jgi:hypothetical protein
VLRYGSIGSNRPNPNFISNPLLLIDPIVTRKFTSSIVLNGEEKEGSSQ